MSSLRNIRKVGTLGGVVIVILLLAGFVYGLRRGRGPQSGRADVGRSAASTGEPRSGANTARARDGVLASATPLTAEQLFAFASPSVAMVEVRDGQMRSIGQGTGFFVPGDGLLVTNFHVIDGASFASVRTGDGQTLFVEGIAATDRRADLALLKIRGASSQPVLRLSELPAPRVGSRVFAIGNPQGLTNTLSEGIVSGHRADLDGGSGGKGAGKDAGKTAAAAAVIQTSAAISPGSSGGPLMTADGAVVGVTSATLTGGQSLNFAVSAGLVRRLIDGPRNVSPLASAAARLIDPADARAYAALFAAMDDSQIREAVAILKSMGDRQKQNPIYWFTAGCVHQRLQNLDIAARYFQKAIELQPTFTEAQIRLAEVLSARGNVDQAQAMYDRVLQAHPRDMAAFRGRVQLLTEKGEHVLAMRAIDEALKADPRSVELLGMKGVVYGKFRRSAEAIATFNAAVKLDPDDVMTRVRFGEALIQVGRPKSALIPLKKAIELAPDNAWAYYLLGEASHALKDSTSARLAWRNARRFDPHGPAGGVASERLAGDHTTFSRVGVY